MSSDATRGRLDLAVTGEDGDSEELDLSSRIIANITHELKTPLHSILALAQLLQSESDGPLSEEQKKQVELITKNGHDLLDLISDLLAQSTVATRNRKLRIEEFSMLPFAEQIRDAVLPAAERNGIRVNWDLSRSPAKFASDRLLLRQILMNLLTNAVKFSAVGGIVECRLEGLKDGELLIEVVDNGIGIPVELQKAVFGEFFQVENADNRRFGGVGLGLALVRRSVELLKGRVELKSEEGKGSIFRIHIPSAVHEVERPLIVIADRDANIRLSLEQALQAKGYDTISVVEPAEVIKTVSARKPRLVIVDVTIHDEQECGLLRDLTSLAEGVPIVVMSVHDAAQDRSKAFELGASDYVLKPFDLKELMSRVRIQLGV